MLPPHLACLFACSICQVFQQYSMEDAVNVESFIMGGTYPTDIPDTEVLTANTQELESAAFGDSKKITLTSTNSSINAHLLIVTCLQQWVNDLQAHWRGSKKQGSPRLRRKLMMIEFGGKYAAVQVDLDCSIKYYANKFTNDNKKLIFLQSWLGPAMLWFIKVISNMGLADYTDAVLEVDKHFKDPDATAGTKKDPQALCWKQATVQFYDHQAPVE
ncbi:hypothetical protein M427DRAFT_43969 [Gonapodya prolifera JEL478]|uniref:Uncharacterized protein n=1 Tax=Gonapodya prolifera (strain JEL478) TaxID=1344416 RepID=A0A139AHK5_GONPJ|nr:hypothetical protein M427DRAFT_43969 [Gonapodya prolifera JEL478]|eukprot:KXS16169.1 hypothetical protein M427DRAFT_43969 [Gonapodya prolifera JEL478]